MRNILCFLICVSIFPSFVFGETGGLEPEAGSLITESENKYAFSVSPRSGFLWGQGRELVYNPAGSRDGGNALWSELLWDFKPLWYIGADIDYGPRSPWKDGGFSAGLSVKYGLPFLSGIMEDRDWLADGDSYLTHYSEHYASSRGSSLADIFSGTGTFQAELSGGYSWAAASRVWLKLFGELSFTRYSWMAKDGFYQYAYGTADGYEPWEPSIEKIPLLGKAISYTQNWFVFSPGAAIGIKFTDYLNASFLITISPLVYGYCRDDHYKREIHFLDYLFGGIALRDELEIKFALSEKLEFSFIAAMRYLRGARGDTFTSANGGGGYTGSEDSSGGAYKFADFSIKARFVL